MKQINLKLSLVLIVAMVVGCGQKVEKSGSTVSTGDVKTWHRAYEKKDADLAINCAIVLDDGTIVMGGEFKPINQQKKLFLLKLDSSGELIWNRFLSKSLHVWVQSMAATEDGGFILLIQGMETDAGPAYASLMKVDQEGNYRWDRRLSDSSETLAGAIVPTLDANFMVLGVLKDEGDGSNNTFLMKIDDWGNELWQKTYTGIGALGARTLQADADSGFIVITDIDASSSMHSLDALLFKVDASGNLVWNTTAGGEQIDVVSTVKVDPKSGYWLAGSTQSMGEPAGDVYLARLNEDHEFVWEKSFGDQYPDAALDAVVTPDGGMIAAGASRIFPSGMFQVYLIKVDEDGDKQWDKHYAIGDRHQGRTIVACPDGGYLVAGSALKLRSNQWQAYLLKIDGDGNMLQTEPTVSFLD